MLHDDEGEPRQYGLFYGVVQFNDDPEKIGRVRVLVPGLIEPASPWAVPVGGTHSTGGKGVGGYDVPPVGATVVMGFHGGDVDRPFFMAAFHGQGEQLSAVPNNPADAHKIKVFESDRFLIVLNGIGGSEEVLIKDKVTGDNVSMKPSQLKVTSATKVTVACPEIELGADGLGNLPLINGVVVGAGIDTFTGLTYGALGNASNKVTASK